MELRSERLSTKADCHVMLGKAGEEANIVVMFGNGSENLTVGCRDELLTVGDLVQQE